MSLGMKLSIIVMFSKTNAVHNIMKKILTLVAMVSVSVASAASLSYEELPDTLKGTSSGLVYANSFNGSATASINSAGLPTGFVFNTTSGTGSVGSDVNSTPWTGTLTLTPSFTISFDLVSFSGVNWADVVSMSSTSNLAIEKNDNNEMYLYVGDNFAGSTASGLNIRLGAMDDVVGTSLTVVVDAKSKEITAYSDFEKIGSVTLPFAEGISMNSLAGIQFGAGYGGNHTAKSVEFDNLYVWNKAFTAAEVKSLTAVPEPATATLSLLGLAGLVSRRRRR